VVDKARALSALGRPQEALAGLHDAMRTPVHSKAPSPNVADVGGMID
jgi:hypothetical protein